MGPLGKQKCNPCKETKEGALKDMTRRQDSVWGPEVNSINLRASPSDLEAGISWNKGLPSNQLHSAMLKGLVGAQSSFCCVRISGGHSPTYPREASVSAEVDTNVR